MVFEQVAGHHQLQHRVAEKLHALVRLVLGVLGDEGTMDEGGRQQIEVVEPAAEGPLEFFQFAHQFSRSASLASRFRSAPSAARAMALAIATAEELPWAITTTPSEPTRCAPPKVS